MECTSLTISVGYPKSPKHFFQKQKHGCPLTRSTANTKPRGKWNTVRIVRTPITASASFSCYPCMLAVDGVVGEGNILEKWQRSIDIVKDILRPTPNSPAAGGDLTGFFSASVVLLLVFWLGNYVVPDMIFGDTVFRKKYGDENAESTVVSSEEAAASNANVKREQKAVGFGSKIKSKKKRPKR